MRFYIQPNKTIKYVIISPESGDAVGMSQITTLTATDHHFVPNKQVPGDGYMIELAFHFMIRCVLIHCC